MVLKLKRVIENTTTITYLKLAKG